MDYKKQLEATLEYAVEYRSFSKLNMAENADIVCAYGLGRFFQEAFLQWDFLNKMHVNMVCDSDEKNGERSLKVLGVFLQRNFLK